jgi:RimJ/RimL family protein N-acetyltransferase
VSELNEFSQSVGDVVTNWAGAKHPNVTHLKGLHCDLIRLEPKHAEPLFQALCGHPSAEQLWTYRSEKTPVSVVELASQIQTFNESDSLTFGVLPQRSPGVLGRTSLLRIDVSNGVIEIGGVQYAPTLQRTAASTEATYLLLGHCFEDLGYRRIEWKCNAFNEPSRKAALRLGFAYEGRFRNGMVSRGRSRDTDWFAMTDSDWPPIKHQLADWLQAANFDQAGRQRRRLDLRLDRVG